MKKSKFKLSLGIHSHMELKGWGLKELSEALGYEKSQVCAILSGKLEPSMQFLHRLCDVTGYRLENIIETVFSKDKTSTNLKSRLKRGL